MQTENLKNLVSYLILTISRKIGEVFNKNLVLGEMMSFFFFET